LTDLSRVSLLGNRVGRMAPPLRQRAAPERSAQVGEPVVPVERLHPRDHHPQHVDPRLGGHDARRREGPEQPRPLPPDPRTAAPPASPPLAPPPPRPGPPARAPSRGPPPAAPARSRPAARGNRYSRQRARRTLAASTGPEPAAPGAGSAHSGGTGSPPGSTWS